MSAAGGLARFLLGLRRGQRLRRSRTRRFVFCTIATGGFLPWALVLFDALARIHPDAERVLLYVRANDEADRLPAIAGVRVLAVADLVDAALEAELRRRYGPAELCFALKPPLLRHCLDQGAERAVYLDSDLDLQSPLDAAAIELESASVVLTPHLDAAIPRDGRLPSEITILRAGACNAGFVALAESPQARTFLSWWESRVRHWGFVSPETGYQGDQKWLDLAPSLFEGVALMRDPGSNVGCWNLHGRRLARGASGITANGSPLAFFHFSGFDPDKPAVLSRYQNRIDLAQEPLVAELAARYAARIVEARPRAAALAWTNRSEPTPALPRAPALEGAMPQEGYRPAFALDPPGSVFSTGEEIELKVRITNTSPYLWPISARADGSGGIALSFHLYDHDHKQLEWDNDRFPLPGDLAPGASVEMAIGIRAPDEPGRYVYQLDLVHEDTTWFSNQNGATAAFPVMVGLFEESAAES